MFGRDNWFIRSICTKVEKAVGYLDCGGSQWFSGLEPVHSDQAKLSPVLEGECLISGWGGEFHH